MAGRKPNLTHITPGLRHLAVPISELVPDRKNERLHDEPNLSSIENSLREYGQDQPIVAEAGTKIIIKGHGRLIAAQRMGWTHLAVEYVKKTSEQERRLRNIADNRSAELAKWDYGALARSITDITDAGLDIEKAGFSETDIKNLAAYMAASGQADDAGGGGDDDDPKPMVQRFPAPIQLTWDQFKIFDAVCRWIRAEDGADISPGRIVELVCADYLSGRGMPPDEGDGDNADADH